MGDKSFKSLSLALHMGLFKKVKQNTITANGILSDAQWLKTRQEVHM